MPILALLLVTSAAVSHGGAFKAPPPIPKGVPDEDIYLPLPPRVGPVGPNKPGGSTGPTHTPTGPTDPLARPGGSGNHEDVELDPVHWSYWWDFEQDAYLLGLQTLRTEAGGSAVPRDVVRETVIPALVSSLNGDHYVETQSAALIALARIGRTTDPSTTRALTGNITPYLTSKISTVAESSVLALGILGDKPGLETLLNILSGSQEGCRIIDGKSVPARSRAVAAIALGLYSKQVDKVGVRQRIAHALVDAFERPATAEDVHAAAIIAFGLCSLPNEPKRPPEEIRDSPNASAVVSRAGQIAWLVQHGANPEASLESVTRAHALVALGRLAADATPAVRANAVRALTAAATSSDLGQATKAAACIALGLSIATSEDDADKAGLAALEEALEEGESLERRFAAVALARASARMVSGKQGEVSKERDVLLDRYRAAPKLDKPWIALALGVRSYSTAPGTDANRNAVARLLVERLRKTREPSLKGALAIGTALAHAHAAPKLVEKAQAALLSSFKRARDPFTRSHSAVALGILGASDTREPLWKALEDASFEPELLWSAAIGLKLLGETELTPRLLRSLTKAVSDNERAAAAVALGQVGDQRATEPLVKLLADRTQPMETRAFSIVALGLLCDSNPNRWRSPIAHALPYFAVTGTLQGDGKGLIDIF